MLAAKSVFPWRRVLPWKCFSPRNQFGAIWSQKDFLTRFLDVPTCLFRWTNISFPETGLHFSLKPAKSLRNGTSCTVYCDLTAMPMSTWIAPHNINNHILKSMLMVHGDISNLVSAYNCRLTLEKSSITSSLVYPSGGSSIDSAVRPKTALRFSDSLIDYFKSSKP